MHECGVEIQVEEVKRNIKKRAIQNPNEKPSEIYNDEISKIQNEEVLANLPLKESLLKTIHRERKRQRIQ